MHCYVLFLQIVALARLPKNRAMAKCRNADTTWKWLSASGIQPTKQKTKTNEKTTTQHIRSKTSSHITLYVTKSRVQTLCQNCASENQHKARKAHGKAISSHYGGTVSSKTYWTEKNVAQWKTDRKEERNQTQTQSWKLQWTPKLSTSSR